MAHIDRRPGIRPRASLGRRLDIVARMGFPACITVVLMLLTRAPMDIPGQAALLPAVTMGCVWFWSVFRPGAVPPPVVFVLGLLWDLLGYTPLGVGVFSLLVIHGLAISARRRLSQHGFAWNWLLFSGVAAGASLLMWLLVMLLTFRLLSPAASIFVAVVTIAIFPLLAVPFAGAHRSIANPEDA